MRSRILVVVAMQREAAAVGADLVCGAGERAGYAVDATLRAQPRDLVVIAGVCGGLDPSLAPGALVLAHRVVNERGDERAAGRALFDAARRALRRHGSKFAPSSLLTVARPVATRAQKTDLWNTHGAAGVDMETWHVIEAAASHGARWLALRAVLDPASDLLPPSLRDWNGATSDAAIARALVRRPLEWPAYVRLALQSRAALRSLRTALPIVIAAAESAMLSRDGQPEKEIPLAVRP